MVEQGNPKSTGSMSRVNEPDPCPLFDREMQPARVSADCDPLSQRVASGPWPSNRTLQRAAPPQSMGRDSSPGGETSKAFTTRPIMTK